MSKEIFIFIFMLSFAWAKTQHDAASSDQTQSFHSLSKRRTISRPNQFDTPQYVAMSLSKTFLGKQTVQFYSRRSPNDPGFADIVFVMDNSGSIGPNNFEVEKRFISSLMEFYNSPPPKTRLAVVSYSSKVKLEFNFEKCNTIHDFINEVNNIRYTGGATATGDALEYVLSKLIFKRDEGARSNAKKTVFVLTDGHSNSGVKPSNPARKLRNAGVTIFAMGLTQSINRNELNSIASPSTPKNQYVHRLSDYKALDKVIKELKSL